MVSLTTGISAPLTSIRRLALEQTADCGRPQKFSLLNGFIYILLHELEGTFSLGQTPDLINLD